MAGIVLFGTTAACSHIRLSSVARACLYVTPFPLRDTFERLLHVLGVTAAHSHSTLLTGYLDPPLAHFTYRPPLLFALLFLCVSAPAYGPPLFKLSSFRPRFFIGLRPVSWPWPEHFGQLAACSFTAHKFCSRGLCKCQVDIHCRHLDLSRTSRCVQAGWTYVNLRGHTARLWLMCAPDCGFGLLHLCRGGFMRLCSGLWTMSTFWARVDLMVPLGANCPRGWHLVCSLHVAPNGSAVAESGYAHPYTLCSTLKIARSLWAVL